MASVDVFRAIEVQRDEVGGLVLQHEDEASAFAPEVLAGHSVYRLGHSLCVGSSTLPMHNALVPVGSPYDEDHAADVATADYDNNIAPHHTV
ncbi:MAG TPA: hypothetical protein VNG32_00185 [Candidatus Dormibacteraeota bacterium]|nr:hypothetical protein [Candidatus Dormibacteraeota bacterium]